MAIKINFRIRFKIK